MYIYIYLSISNTHWYAHATLFIVAEAVRCQASDAVHLPNERMSRTVLARAVDAIAGATSIQMFVATPRIAPPRIEKTQVTLW